MKNVKIFNHGTQKAYGFTNITHDNLLKLQKYILNNYLSVKICIKSNPNFLDLRFSGYILVK